MTVNFYKTFSKRKNSTKQPAAADTYDAIDCKLKEDCSIENPSFIISQRTASASGNPVTVNAQQGDMINPVITFNPVQSGSGTPSPSNPRPIVAYSSIDVGVNGNTTVIDLNGNKYGGVLDVSTGVLTLKYLGVDLGSFTWNMNTGLTRNFTTTTALTNAKLPAGPADTPSALCEQYDVVAYQDATPDTKNLTIIFASSYARGQIWITNHDYNTPEAFKTAMTGVYLVYELATYQTVQLTPEQIALVQGTNTITVNGNSSIAFSYKKDKIDLTYTYVQVPDFNRYYFVSNVIILSNNRVEYVCECDALASFKSNIGSTVAQVAFSATGYDIWKVDHRLPVKVTKTITKASGTPGAFDGSGVYVLGVSNVDAGTSVVCFYAMTQAELQAFMAEVATDTNLKDSVKNYCSDVWDAIISCTWIPVSQSEVPGSSQSVKISNYTCTSTGKKISNPPARATSVTVSIPWSYNDFRRQPPFTTLAAWIPGYGYVSLNASDLVNDTSVKFNFMIDCITGDICCNIIDAVNSYIYQTISYNAGVAVPLSRYTQNVAEMISQTAGFMGSGAGLMGSVAMAPINPIGVIGGLVSTLSSGAQLCLAANSRDVSVKGGVGGRAIISEGIDVELYAFSVDTEDPTNASYIAAWGRPVGITHAISTHSGYVQCDGASVNIGGTPLERQRINDYLNSGFFYE